MTLLPQAPGETLPLEDPRRRPHDQSLPKTGMTGHRGPQRPMRPSWDPNFFSLDPNHSAFGESRKWVHALLTKSPAAWRGSPERAGHAVRALGPFYDLPGAGRVEGKCSLLFLQNGEVSSLGPASFQSSMTEWLSASPQRRLELVPGLPPTSLFRVVFHFASLSHSFCTFPFSSVVSPSCSDSRHPQMTRKSLCSPALTGSSPLGPHKRRLIKAFERAPGSGR